MFSSPPARVFYPYDLDFIEDGILMQSLRFAKAAVFLPPNASLCPTCICPVCLAWRPLFRLAGPAFYPAPAVVRRCWLAP